MLKVIISVCKVKVFGYTIEFGLWKKRRRRELYTDQALIDEIFGEVHKSQGQHILQQRSDQFEFLHER